jgi:hypothetical protein
MKSVKAIYGLSPMQQGMQFHSLNAPESGVYIQQFCCRLRGSLDHEAFARRLLFGRGWRNRSRRSTIALSSKSSDSIGAAFQRQGSAKSWRNCWRRTAVRDSR